MAAGIPPTHRNGASVLGNVPRRKDPTDRKVQAQAAALFSPRPSPLSSDAQLAGRVKRPIEERLSRPHPDSPRPPPRFDVHHSGRDQGDRKRRLEDCDDREQKRRCTPDSRRDSRWDDRGHREERFRSEEGRKRGPDPLDDRPSAKRRRMEAPRVSSEPRTHALTIQSRPEAPYIQFIKNGQKTAEGRIFRGPVTQYKEGDKLKLYNRQEGIVCRITFVHRYSSFKEMVTKEGPCNLLPQLKGRFPEDRFIDEAVKVYQGFPGSERVHTDGCVAIGVKYLGED